MPGKINIVTGPIVGLRSSWFIKDTIKFAASVGEKIVAFNLFDEILEQSGEKGLTAYEKASYIGDLLDGYSYQFQLLREKAYYSIANKILRLDDNTNVIIRTPASIEWRGYNLIFKDARLISEIIKPDAIITLIDAEWKIKKRLESNYGKHVLKEVAHQEEISIPKILEWLASEVSVSEDWADWASYITNKKVGHIVLGVEVPSYRDRNKYVRDVNNFAKLVTQKDIPTFYASYSMTVASQEIREKIHSYIWKLRAYGVVIDPASIELGGNVEEEHKDIVFAYTICRDLKWDVQKVDTVVAFHPYPENPPLSTGMMDELGHARAFGKERYLVLPVGGSPFAEGNIVPNNHLFKTGEEFFDYIEHSRNPSLKPRYKNFQKALTPNIE